MRRVREEMGLTNVMLMLPFVRRVAEADLVLQTMAELGLRRGENGLEVYAMCEIPNNVILIDQFAKRFDGFSIGSNDLTQLTLGVDRDSEIVAFDYDERDEGVKEMIRLAVEGCRRNGIHSGLCGQAPSDYPDMAEFLVRTRDRLDQPESRHRGQDHRSGAAARATARGVAMSRHWLPCRPAPDRVPARSGSVKLPVTIDPRYHDAVVFDLDGALIDDASLFAAMVALARNCRRSGVATAAHAAGPNCQDVLKAAGVDDLFDVYIDSLEAARRLGVSPQRAVVVEDTEAGVQRGSRRRIRTRHRCRPDRTRRHTVAARSRCRARRPGRRRGSRGGQANLRTPECPGLLWSARRRHQRTTVDVVSRLRRNVVPDRVRSGRGRARRRRGRGAGPRRRGVPRGRPERSRPRGHSQPRGRTGDLVRRQPRVRADGTGRYVSPERRGRHGRARPRARSR